MRSLLALTLMVVISVQASAQEKKPKANKGGGGLNPQVTKMAEAIKSLDLSDEQSAQFAAATEKFQAEMKTLRADGLTAELAKKRAEASKAAREAGLKGKEIQAKVMESMSEEEVALMKKADAAMMTLKKAVAGMLTDDQMAALPEAVQKQLTIQEPKKGKGKKNA